MRAVKGTDTVLRSPIFTGADGETPSNLDTGVPTVTVTRENGTALSAPTATAVSPAETGIYQVTLTGATHTSQVDRLAVTWTGTAGSRAQVFRQEVQVVGSQFCTIAELRKEDSLGRPETVPTPVLQTIRDEFADLAEAYCGVAFTRSYQRDQLPGNNTDTLLLSKRRPRTVIAATIDGTTVTGFELTPIGQIIYTGNTWSAPSSTLALNCVITYEHGYDAVPDEIRRAAVMYVRQRALSRLAHTRVDVIYGTDQDGVPVRFSTPDARAGRPTGLLEVDAILNSLRERLPAVG